MQDKTRKLVSIVLPTYNGSRFIRQSIESCLNQSYKNIELIIVDDCSTDNTPEIIRAFSLKDSRVKVIRNPTNSKLPKSLNIGFKAASGDYFTWASDDNYFEPNAIESMAAYLDANEQTDLVYSAYNIIEEDGGFRLRFGDIPEALIFQCVVGACFLYKRKVHEKLKGYAEDTFMMEDYDFWLRASVHFRFSFIDQLLCNYRRHPNSLSTRIHTQEDLMKTFRKLHADSFSNFYNSYFPGLLSPDEIDCMVSTYLELLILEDPKATMKLQEDSKKLLAKMDELPWERTQFDKSEIRKIIARKREDVFGIYIKEIHYLKQTLAEVKAWYTKEYEILPLWYKRVGHLIKIVRRDRKLLPSKPKKQSH